MLVLSSMAVLLLGTCPAGQVINADTKGNCCYAGQVWSTTQSRCIGLPTACPPGLEPGGDSCVTACPQGMTSGPDTAGQCCWPNQAWAASRNRCVGTPACPAGLTAAGETCVARGLPPPPPMPYPGAYSPVAGPDSQRVALEAKLADLRYKRSRVSYAPGIITLSIGIPMIVLGWAVTALRTTAALVIGYSTVIVGGALATTGSILLPIAAVRAGILSRQIRAAEVELAQYRAFYAPQLEPALANGLALMVSSPVFSF